MKKIRPRNIKVLNDDEMAFINDRFIFEIKGDLILVSSKKMKRATAHKKTESFDLNFKFGKQYSWMISSLAIQIWEYGDKTYSLIDIQNAINKLLVMYQEPSQEDVLKLLKRQTEEIIKV